MCLAVPAKVIELENEMAKVDLEKQWEKYQQLARANGKEN